MKHLGLILVFVSAPLFTPLYANEPPPSPAAAHYEVKFMTGMLDHHALAIMLADLCLPQAVHPEMKRLCENIRATQTREIALMHGWLHAWYGIAYTPEAQATSDSKRLASLAGELFEIEFLQLMIRHHATAVRQSRACQRKAFHTELLALCRSIEITQTQEFHTMQAWLCAWYRLCDWGPRAIP